MEPGQAPKAEALRRAARRGLTPPLRLSVAAWADRFRYLAREAGSTAGKWHTSTVEVARGAMLAVTEPGVHVISAMFCTQLLKTALLENVTGYFAHLDPCPILLLQPKEDAALQFSKERIATMVRVTPVLRDLIGTRRMRNAEETLLFKSFPGGFLALAGAGSPDNLARRPVRVVLSDEIDKYPLTREGEPIALAEERTATFANWLSIRACSPTIEGQSRIASAYAESDQRRASVACPHCGHRQFLEFFSHVKWARDAEDETRHLPKTARIYCEACGAQWSEAQRLRALATARWHQTAPYTCCGVHHEPLEEYANAWRALDPCAGHEAALDAVWTWWASDLYAVYRVKCPKCGAWPVDNRHAGFTASKLYSPWAKDRPAEIAVKWLAAHTDETLKQVWWNTQAGQPYRVRAGKEVKLEVLAARAEHWPGEVPAGVGVLTAGIDVQSDRVEMEVVGWGKDEESWSIAYDVIEGDPSAPDLWHEVDAALMQTWRRDDGRPFSIMAACIDSGGHATQSVYAFAKERIGRRVWAIKGESARTGQRSPVWPTKKPTRRTKASYRPVILGVNAAKDSIRDRLALDQPGPGFMHFPADRDRNYYAQLTAERIIVKEVAGHKFYVWELPAGRANEALDCRVYAYAALCGLLHFGLRLNVFTDRAAAAYGDAGSDGPRSSGGAHSLISQLA
ncbi:phage terminase large subunit family protein [Paraburkholderia adhaesiva]|uniref:phage terminase large subunit family protein n=1 Tax=Paraburkholderia adhaesiva TaxID=2883244 RepID=UPI001F23BB27|nr:terminase gpA endonuclease subunit [Paraburkholderia adhaesiva]